MSADPAKTNDGIEYQFRVISYIAHCLSENEDVRNYHIYTNQEIPIFDDAMVKVWYTSKPNPSIYLTQVKHKSKHKNYKDFNSSALKAYKERLSKIIDKIKQIEKMDKIIQDLNENIEQILPDEKIINYKNKIVEEKKKIIEQKNEIISTKNQELFVNENKVMDMKNKIIQDISRNVEDRNKAIDEKNKIIDKKDMEHIKDFFLNVPEENIEFWFFCNKKPLPVGGVTTVNNIKCDIIKLEEQAYEPIFSFSESAACFMLRPKMAEELTTEDKNFLERYRLFLNQPNYKKIIKHMSELNEHYTNRMMNDIVKYVTEYLKLNRSQCLTKELFEIELLKLFLSAFIIPPTKSIEIHDDLTCMWNLLTLRYDLTIVDEDRTDMKAYLFGCLYQTLGSLLECNIHWNDYIHRPLSKVLNHTKFNELIGEKNKGDTLDSLLTELWKCDYLPLILNEHCKLSILKKYKHLKKKFVILGKSNKIIKEIGSTNMKIFASLSDIRDDEVLSLREKLLDGITVSFQGREAISLLNLINEDATLMEKIKCSHILRLMKKNFKLFLEERCLQDTHSMIFIVEDDSNTSETNFEKNVASDDNIIINCKPCEVDDCITKVKVDSSLNNRPVHHLRRLLSNRKLQILTEVDSCINSFITDEDGNDIFFNKERSIPIIGTRVNRKHDKYIPRFLQKAIVQTSFFSRTEKRLCFFVGDVNSLEASIKGRIINETTSNLHELIERKLEQNQSVYVATEDKCVEQHWSKFSSNEYPLYQIRVINGTMIMLKYKNTQNVNSHISYEGHTFEEDSFFEETTNAITIVTGEPGMGKTTLLHSLFKKYDKRNYAIFCDLVNCRADFEKENNKLYEDPLQYMSDKFEKIENATISNRRSLLDDDILNSLCKFHQSTNRLLVLLDSLDEVLPACKTQVLKFINALAKSNIRIVIASRLIADNLLSNDFEAQPLKIARLDTNTIKEYLRNEQVICTDIHKIPVVLLETPLYLKFLIALFKKNPSSPRFNNICNLYEEIITEKIDIWLKKMSTCNNKSNHQRDDILKEHKLLALQVIFGKKINSDLDYDHLKNICIDTNKVKVGIIVRFSEEYPIFVHQTLAEYLVAEWLAENISTSVAKNIYLEICTPSKMHLKYMFDNILCKDLELHTAVLNEDLEQVEHLCRQNDSIKEVDKCGRTVLHLVASALSVDNTDIPSRRNLAKNLKILDAIIKRMDKYGNNIYELPEKFTKKTWFEMLEHLSYTAYDELFKELSHLGLTNTIKKYLEHTGKTVMQKDIGFNIKYNFPAAMYQLKKNPSKVPYHYYRAVKKAIDFNYLNNILDLAQLQEQNLVMTGFEDLHINCISGKIVKYCSKANVNALDDFQNIPLHYGVLTNSTEMLSELIPQTLDINTEGVHGNTPLHFAVKFSETDIVLTLLMHQKIKINCGNNFNETPLHIAARKGRIDIVKLLIKNRADINFKNAKGETPLYIAVKNDHEDIVRILLEKDARTDTMDNFSNNALHVAAEIGNKCVVEMLLEKGAGVNLKNNLGHTALHIAVIYEKVYVTQLLLGKDTDIINCQNYRGQTALHEAVENRNAVVVDILLRKGADVNIVNYRNESALYLAVSRWDEGIIEILLENGADVNYQQFQRAETAFDIALQKGNVNIIKSLMRSGSLTENTLKRSLSSCILLKKRLDILKIVLDKCISLNPRMQMYTFLEKAISSGFTDALELLRNKYKTNIDPEYSNGFNVLSKMQLVENIAHGNASTVENGENVNVHDLNNRLCSASAKLDLSPVRLLLDRGANASYITDNGFSALHTAASTGNMEMLQVLLENGRNIVLDMRNKNDASLLYIAIEKESQEVVKLLLEKGANPNFVDHYYHYGHNSDNVWDVFAKQNDHIETGDISALCLAIRKRNEGIIRILIENNGDVNINYSETPLQVAIKHQYTHLVKFLLENGADVNVGTRKDSRHQISNEENLSAMQMAVQMRNMNIIKLLLKHGAHVDTFYHGKTALELACTNGDTEIVGFLLDNGANVNFKRPLYWAVSNGHEDAIKLLLDKIEYVSALNDTEQNLLNIAVKAEKINIINMLIEKGIRINIQGEDGNTPLSNALYLRRLDIVKLLLDKGANINYRHRYGDTALHIATRHHSLDIINTLLRKGADTTLRNIGRATALRTAFDIQRFSITISLLKYDLEIALLIRQWGPLLLLGSLVLYFIIL